MNQHTADVLAGTVLRDEMTRAAKEAANAALASVNLAEILDRELPGLEGEARNLVLASGQLMVEGGVQYVGITDAIEARYMKEEAWTHGDAMVATFDAPVPRG